MRTLYKASYDNTELELEVIGLFYCWIAILYVGVRIESF